LIVDVVVDVNGDGDVLESGGVRSPEHVAVAVHVHDRVITSVARCPLPVPSRPFLFAHSRPDIPALRDAPNHGIFPRP